MVDPTPDEDKVEQLEAFEEPEHTPLTGEEEAELALQRQNLEGDLSTDLDDARGENADLESPVTADPLDLPRQSG